MKWGKQTPQPVPASMNAAPAVQAGITTIGSDALLSGEITLHSNLRVEGELKAKVSVGGCLTVGAQGRIISQSVVCADADISGRIEGDITVAGTLSLRPGGVIDGNITAGNIIIEQGGRFCGQSRYLSDKESEELSVRLGKPAAAVGKATTEPRHPATESTETKMAQKDPVAG